MIWAATGENECSKGRSVKKFYLETSNSRQISEELEKSYSNFFLSIYLW